MAIERMKLMKISGALEQLPAVSEALCESESFQPDAAAKYISSSMGFLPFADENPYTQKLATLTDFAASLGFPLEVQAASVAATDDADDAYIRAVEARAAELLETRRILTEQKEVCEDGIRKYSHFTGLDLDLDGISACEFVKVRFGHMPKESAERLQTVFKDYPYLLFCPCSEDKTDYWGVYFAPVDRLDEVDGIFAFLLFEPFSVPGAAGTVDEVLAEIRKSIAILDGQLSENKDQLRALWKEEQAHCNQLYTGLLRKDAIFSLRSYALHNERSFMLVGFVPESRVHKVAARLDVLEGVSTEVGEPPKSDKVSVPVEYKKRGPLYRALVAPYRYYIEMYGSPGRSDVDVTPFVAFTYTILFGIMFGDLGQGLVVSLAGLLLWKLKKMELGKILIPCGLSSVVFGFLFGSVFGFEDLLDPVYHAMGLSGKPFSVMDSINTVLLIAIGIGVVLMVAAMLIHVYASFKRKQVGEALFSQNGVAGIVLYLMGVNLASGFMGGPAPVPTGLCAALLGVSAVLVYIKEIPIGLIDRHPDWKPDSIGDFLLQNFFELIEYLLSYLSNTLSFLRVGAYVLVHAGMMMVVFSLAGESENLFVIVLGNILVIVLEGLLTGIQVLRLEYYEMFSRFYEGDGVPFTPISLKKIQKHSN